nr:hypothetical protein [Tanacetum cinerariifolium]
KGDDPIDAINHIMSFLTAVVISRNPTTNNQLRNSSNPRQQATINNERVTLQPIQGRHTSLAAGTSRTYTPRVSGNHSGKQRTVICYNCKGEGHISKLCTKPKRKWDDSRFKDKVLLVQAQPNGQILHEDELAFLADPGIAEAQPMHVTLIMMKSTLPKLHSWRIYLIMVQTILSSDSNIIHYSQYVSESQQAAVNCTKINMDNKSVNDTLTAELERYKDQVRILKEGQNVELKSKDNVLDSCAQSKAQQLEPKLYDGNIIEKTNAIVIRDSEETLMLAKESRSKMILKQKDHMMSEKKVNTTLVDYAVLNQLSHDFETRFVLQTKLSAEQAFWS